MIVREYSNPIDKEFDVVNTFYRNKGDEEAGAHWAGPNSLKQTTIRGDVAEATSIEVFDREFSPDERIKTNSLLDIQNDITEANLLMNWNALVVEIKDSSASILRNTLQGRDFWEPLESKQTERRYYHARHYLIKYQDTPTPRRQVFFSSEAYQADCVYIKPISADSGVAGVNIQRPSGDDYVTIRLGRGAKCPSL